MRSEYVWPARFTHKMLCACRNRERERERQSERRRKEGEGEKQNNIICMIIKQKKIFE